jgi:hypothetical protein
MSFILKDTITITASTAAATSYYSTAVNAVVHAIACRPPSTKALKAKATLTICSESSLGPPILTVKPSTVRTIWYPRRQAHGSTGAVLGSSAAPRVSVALYNERIKVNIPAASSKNSINGVLDIYYA